MNSANPPLQLSSNQLIARYKINSQREKERVQDLHLAQRLSSFLITEYQREAHTNPNYKLRDMAVVKIKENHNLQRKFYGK